MAGILWVIWPAANAATNGVNGRISLSICLIKSFMRLHCVELEVSYVCSSEEKLNHVLKTDGDKLFKYLLTNKIFSKQILS